MKLKVLVLSLLMVCFFCVNQVLAAGWQPDIKVGLQANQLQVKLVPSLNAQLTDGSNKVILNVKAHQPVAVSYVNKQMLVNGKKTAGKVVELKAGSSTDKGSMVISINGKLYRGGVRLAVQGNGLQIINVVPIEKYLYGAVPEEMSEESPVEALKAQIVAARTYALHQRSRHASKGYDVCATTHCQAYGGVASEAANVNKLVDATSGEVLYYQGSIAETPFHADSGGMTENVSNVWGSSYPYLVAATEVKTGTMPWQKSFSLNEVNNLLTDSGYNIGTLQKVVLSPLTVGKAAKDRYPSGRVDTAVFIGNKGKAAIEGEELRNIFSLKSTLFGVNISGGKLNFNGFGFGHGVGMSQNGAKAYAATKNYQEILGHYYKGTTIKKLY